MLVNLYTILCCVVLFNIYFANAGHHFTFPEPVIEIFKPEGLRVTLPNSPRNKLFVFHANINKPISTRERGEIFEECTKKTKGNWVIEDPSVKLQPGDKLYYWMFVLNGHLGYIDDGGVFEVESHKTGNHFPETTTKPPCDSRPGDSSRICEQVVLNLTQSYIQLEEEIESLKESNRVLNNLVQKYPDLCRGLTLEGLVVSDADLKMTVQAIIEDKLGLPFKAKDIVRSENGNIQFQVGSLSEKLQVIKIAKEKLKHSQYSISY